MIPKTLRTFVTRLQEATEEGELKWTEGAPDAYFCSRKQYDIHISFHLDGDREVSLFRFVIKSKGGQEAVFTVGDDEHDFAKMKDLYSAVTVRAAGFDNIEEDFF